MPKVRLTAYPFPRGVASWCHISTPDTTAPENASWKPDGKYKITVILDSEEPLAKIRAAFMATAKEKWPDVDPEDIHLPWRFHDDDDKNENLRNKVTVVASSQYRPALYDAKKQPVPLVKREGKEVYEVAPYGGDIVRFVAQAVPYEKTEKVKEGKKYVEETMRGISLRLTTVQLIEKRGGAGGADLLDEEEGFSVGGGGSFSDTPDTEGEVDGGDF